MEKLEFHENVFFLRHCGRKSTSEAQLSGRPTDLVTSKTFEEIHDMVLAFRSFKVPGIAEAIGKRHDAVVSILNDHYGMIKLSARWLKIDNKRNCEFHELIENVF